eukprot:c39622_g1_i1 orf=2-283(-)
MSPLMQTPPLAVTCFDLFVGGDVLVILCACWFVQGFDLFVGGNVLASLHSASTYLLVATYLLFCVLTSLHRADLFAGGDVLVGLLFSWRLEVLG